MKKCDQCAKPLCRRANEAKTTFSKRKHCSATCARRAWGERLLKKTTPAARALATTADSPVARRFWLKVAIGAGEACWEWQGSKTHKGYGQFYLTRMQGAHRVAWVLANGRPVPDGLNILHNCDNPACCNPRHLRPGTHTENMRDCVDRGRRPALRGAASPRAKISNEKAMLLLREWPKFSGSLSAFTKLHAVSYHATWFLLNGKSWRHLNASSAEPGT